ncbi:MAG: glycosyltransferase family 8 protein [Eubacteriales bacterium]|nr:glycosyltransferase family 8 protein [Eubacteriales bacterium]
MREDRLEVVYASNDGYARHLGVSMCSLFDRNQDFPEIRVHVLSMGISEENRQRLLHIAQRYERPLAFVEMEDMEGRLGSTADTGGYDISIMLRLFMGEALPESLERVLYLDCDTVVLQSLRGLWRTRLEGCVLGAVMEPTIYPEVKEAIGLGPADPYYNSGVLLVDLTQWRRERVQEELLEFWRQKGGTLFASDQDVINGCLKGRIFSLKPRYNFFTNYRYFSYKALVRCSGSYRAVTRQQLADARKHPAIVHYMGDERPWIAGNLNHYRLAYDRYLAQTEWAGTKREPGRRGYMLAYHAMDYLTAVCPAARMRISRKFGMKVVENRKKANTACRTEQDE